MSGKIDQMSVILASQLGAAGAGGAGGNISYITAGNRTLPTNALNTLPQTAIVPTSGGEIVAGIQSRSTEALDAVKALQAEAERVASALVAQAGAASTGSANTREQLTKYEDKIETLQV